MHFYANNTKRKPPLTRRFIAAGSPSEALYIAGGAKLPLETWLAGCRNRDVVGFQVSFEKPFFTRGNYQEDIFLAIRNRRESGELSKTRAALELLLPTRGANRTKREKLTGEFQDPDTGPLVLIRSVKAGGVGITLTKANQVFHFDRWWNPPVAGQATNRAFRIGQQKNGFVHTFVTFGTLQ